MIDEKTPNYQFPLPHPSNLLSEDVERLRETLIACDQLLQQLRVKIDARLEIKSMDNTDPNSLNTTSDYGIYGQTKNRNASLATGYPIEKAGTLLVVPSAYGVQQLYFPYDGSYCYVRNRTATGWGAWGSVQQALDQQLTEQNQALRKVKILALAGL